MTYSFKALVGSDYYDLPDWGGQKSIGFDFSDVGILAGQYAKNGTNYDVLTNPSGAVIIAYWNGVEQFNCRFYVQAGEATDADPTAPYEKIVAPSIMDMFRRVVVEELAGSPGAPLVFSSATPGAILVNLLTAAQARGAATGITWNFTATHDSAGVPWAFTIPRIEYKIGLRYIDLMRNLVDQGLIEMRFNGTQFQVFNADGMGTDHTVTNSIELHAGRDYSETPRKWSIAERAKFSMAIGDEGIIVRATDATVPDGPFGREEQAVSQGGTKDTGTLALVNDAALSRARQIHEQLTRKVVIREDGPVPAVDYQVSDWINERVAKYESGVETTESARYRIRSMVVDVDDSGSIGTASLVLNDKFLEAEIRLARKVTGIIGGASLDGGGNGLPTPIPEESLPDTTVPKAPTALGLTTDAYTDPQTGIAAALITVAWTPPTQNTDDSVLTDLEAYEVWYQRDGETFWNRVGSTTDTSMTFSGLVTGKLHTVRVYAYDTGRKHRSLPLQDTITTATDNVAPPKPSTPSALVYYGSVQISWDGKGISNAPMPVDFAGARLWYSKVNDFDPSTDPTARVFTTISAHNRWSSVTVTGLDYNVPYYFKLEPYDKAGNVGSLSDQTSASARQLLDADVSNGSLTTKSFVNEIRASLGQVFFDDFSDISRWAIIQSAAPNFTSVTESEALTGGSVGRAAGQLIRCHETLIPYDPDQLYRVTCRVRDMSSKTTTFSGGVAGVAADGTTWVNATGANSTGAQFTMAPSGLNPDGSWNTYVGYFKGTAASVTIQSRPDPKNPLPLHNNVKFIRPLIVMNWGGISTDIMQIDMMKVEAVPVGLVERINIGDAVIGTAQMEDLSVIDAKIASVKANKILTAELAATQRIIAGPENSTHAEVSDTGIRAYIPDGEGGTADIVRLGTSESDVISVSDVNGGVVAGLSDLGVFVGQRVESVEDPVISGFPLQGQFEKFDPVVGSGARMDGHLDKIGWGLIAAGRIGGGVQFNNLNSWMQELNFIAFPGRTYEIRFTGGLVYFTVAGHQRGLMFGYATPSSPGGSAWNQPIQNGCYSWTDYAVTGSSAWITLPAVSQILRCNQAGTAAGGELNAGHNRMFMGAFTTSTNMVFHDTGAWWSVWDVGPDYPANQQVLTLGTTTASQTAKQTYVTRWYPSASETYTGTGAARTNTTDILQGYTPYYPSYGDMFGQMVFNGNAFYSSNSTEVGKTITSALSGRTLVKAEWYGYAKHWHYGNGGTARIRTGTATSLSSTAPTGTYIDKAGWPRGAGRLVNITSIFTTSTRSVYLGRSGGTNPTFYGRFAYQSESIATRRPYLQLTYSGS